MNESFCNRNEIRYISLSKKYIQEYDILNKKVKKIKNKNKRNKNKKKNNKKTAGLSKNMTKEIKRDIISKSELNFYNMLIPECSECYSSYCRCENLFDPYYYEDVFNDWDYYSEYIDYEGIYDFNYNYECNEPCPDPFCEEDYE